MEKYASRQKLPIINVKMLDENPYNVRFMTTESSKDESTESDYGLIKQPKPNFIKQNISLTSKINDLHLIRQLCRGVIRDNTKVKV